MRSFDAWVGKTLFHPLIIRACQALNWNQYKFAREALSLGWLFCFADAVVSGGTIWLIVAAGMFVFTLAQAHYFQSMFIPADSTFDLIVRLVFFFLAWLQILATIVDPVTNIFFLVGHMLLLFAVYAVTISTIPPLETKSERRFDKTVSAS